MNKNFFALLFLCFSAGIAAAVLSLTASAFFQPFLDKMITRTLLAIASLVILEEVSKFVIVWFLFCLTQSKSFRIKSFFYALLLALGFSFLEILLITINSVSLNFSIIFVFLVHLVTFLFWIWAVYFAKQCKSWLIFSILALLSGIFHLVYNLFAMNDF